MSDIREVRLVEGAKSPVPEAVAALLARGPWGRKLGLERAWDGTWTARSQRVVGVLPLDDGWVVRVRPKLEVTSVAAMVAEVYDLPSLVLHPEGPPMDEVDALLDPLARVFAERVRLRARRGLVRRYVAEEDELAAVRGRIDLAASLRLALRGRPVVRCHFEELTSDVGDNQILLSALVLLARSRALSDRTRVLVEDATRLLAGDITLRLVRPDECLGRDYDTLNADYRGLHRLARFFLAHLSSDLGDLAAGAPFTLDMAHLFERFVARRLAAALPRPFTLAAHERFEDDKADRANPDLVVRDSVGSPLAVLDTKYKDGTQIGRADLHQVIYYAARLRCRLAVLVYPHALHAPAREVGDIAVHRAGFDLSISPDSAVSRLVAALPLSQGRAGPEDVLDADRARRVLEGGI